MAKTENSTRVVDVTASNARPTRTGVERGVDVDVSVTLDNGETLAGHVTLLPAADGRQVYESWGDCPDCWISHGLLDGLGDAGGLSTIESAAAVLIAVGEREVAS